MKKTSLAKILLNIFIFSFLLTGCCFITANKTSQNVFAKSFKKPRSHDIFQCPIRQIPDLDGKLEYRNFRTCRDDIKTPPNIKKPSLKGLKDLNISGSSQFSFKGLKEMVKKINHQSFIVVDLREECHAFVNNRPISWKGYHNWANIGYTLYTIKNEELARLHGFSGMSVTNTEEDICKKAGVMYFRIPVTDHIRPQDDDVDEFMNFTGSIEKGTWLHFHCRAGKGRTTTFMIMYDMMKNAKTTSMEAIVFRQFLLGGANIFKKRNKDSYKYELANERIRFIKNFYRYCKTSDDRFSTPWSKWVENSYQ